MGGALIKDEHGNRYDKRSGELIQKGDKPRTQFKPKYDFMKYYRVVKHWAVKNYDIDIQDLEMILYLYSEGIFSHSDFKEIEVIYRWDKKRLNRLIEKGFIKYWRDPSHVKGRKKRLYELSLKGKRMCNSFYKKLIGEEKIPQNRQKNKIYGKTTYIEKMYRKIIEKMNSENFKSNTPDFKSKFKTL